MYIYIYIYTYCNITEVLEEGLEFVYNIFSFSELIAGIQITYINMLSDFVFY